MKSVYYDKKGKSPKPQYIYRPASLKTIDGDVLDVELGGKFKKFKAKRGLSDTR